MAEIHKFTPNLFAAHCGLCRLADEAADGVEIPPNVGKLKLNEASVFVKCEEEAGGITMNTWAAAKIREGRRGTENAI
jgi:hypothetical protein